MSLLKLAKTGAAVTDSRTASGAVARVENRLAFTVDEASQLLGISRPFAYEAAHHGVIPPMPIGRRILILKAALQRFLEQVNDSGTSSES
jgi:excisionase family DNA binding protein